MQFPSAVRLRSGSGNSCIEFSAPGVMIKNFMNKSLIRMVLAALMSVMATAANSGTLMCSGTVAEVAYHSPGKLMVRLNSMNTGVIFCSTDSDWSVTGTEYGSTSPSACKALYSTFLTAKALGTTTVQIRFDGDSVPATCTSFAPWASVSIRYATS